MARSWYKALLINAAPSPLWVRHIPASNVGEATEKALRAYPFAQVTRIEFDDAPIPK